MVMVSVHKKNPAVYRKSFLYRQSTLSICSVRRRWKNVDSSSKSNPLRRRGKNYDASTWRRRGLGVVVEKKFKKSTNFQQKFVW